MNQTLEKQRKLKTDFNKNLSLMKAEIEKALPAHVNADYFMRVCTTAVTRTPGLLECTTASLFGSIIQASQLGLAPDGLLGLGYLIPYRDSRSNTTICNFQVGYKGYINLMYRSGKINNVIANAVYEGDEFNYDLSQGIEYHKPGPNRNDTKKITHFYCIVDRVDGGRPFEVWTKQEMDHHAKRFSKAFRDKTSPWHEHYVSMGKKTMIRMVAGNAELSTEVNTAVGLDAALEAGRSQRNATLVDTTGLPDEVAHDIEHQVIEEDKNEKKSDAVDKKEAQAKEVVGQVKADL